MYKFDTLDVSGLELSDSASGTALLATVASVGGSAAAISVRGAPRLTGSTPADDLTGVAPAGAVITLQFNEAVQRGSGTVYITNGVAQTVIDRATGLPVMRIAGATDTRAIEIGDSANVTISGNVVSIKAGTLLSDTKYSVLVDKGALTDNDGNPFGGIADSARLDFTTSAPGLAPTATITLDQTTVGMGDTIGVTVTFSEAVQTITAADFIVANGTLGSFTANAGKTVWSASFTPAATTYDASNVITLPAANFRDLGGTSGAASAASGNYVVDTLTPLVMDSQAELADVAADLVLTFSEAVYWEDASDIIINLGDGIIEISSSQVSWSDDHTQLTIPAAAHGLQADELYVLTLPVSMCDSAANQVLNRVLTVDTYSGGRISSISIVDDGESDSDNVTSVGEQTISGSYTGTLDAGDTIRLVVNGELLPEGAVEVDTVARTWYWMGNFGGGENSVVAYIAGSENIPRGLKSLAFEVDDSAPQLSDGYEYGGVDPAAALTLVFDENIYWTDTSKLSLSDGSTTVLLGAGDVTIEGNLLIIDAASHGMALGRSYTLNLPGGLEDQFGNGTSDQVVHLDTTPDESAPHALAAYVTTADGLKKEGDLVTIIVRFDEAVKVDNWAELQVGPSQYASYDHHVGTDVTFHYVVQAGDNFDNLSLFGVEGLVGTVRDLADNYLDAAGILFNVLQDPEGGGVNIDVDGQAPDAVTLTGLASGSDTGDSASDKVTGDQTPTFAGTGAEAYATIRLLKNGTLIASSAANGDGDWEITAPTQGSGMAAYTVVQEDGAGNRSDESDALEVTVDASGPSKISNDTVANVLSLVFDEAFSFDGGAIYVYDGETLVETITKTDTEFWAIDPDTHTLTLQPLLDSGDYTVKFAADTLVDEFGNALTELVGAVPGVDWSIYHL